MTDIETYSAPMNVGYFGSIWTARFQASRSNIFANSFWLQYISRVRGSEIAMFCGMEKEPNTYPLGELCFGLERKTRR